MFADVAGLRQRGLVEEKDGRFDIKFAPRTGSFPKVCAYMSRQDEIDGTAKLVAHLVREQKVNSAKPR